METAAVRDIQGETTISVTKSLCPVCLTVVQASVVERDGRVYLKKSCPEHGSFDVYLWPDVKHYRWVEGFALPGVAPRVVQPQTRPCPTGCGLCTSHARHSTLVEIEVTQRCNLRCPVCFVSAGVAPADPSMETLRSMFAGAMARTGPETSIQLTGGEPTVRDELAEIVRMGRHIGFEAIEVNSNGVRIAAEPGYIESLRDSGISGVYLQFDGLTDDVYETIRGRALLSTKLAAIERCREAGVQVVLAMAVVFGVNHDQVGAVLDFALANADVVVGVAFQPAFTSGRFEPEEVVPINMGDVVFMLAEQSHGLLEPYDLWPLSTSHPLCTTGTLLVPEDGTFLPVTRMLSVDEYVEDYDPASPQGSVFYDLLAKKGLSSQGGLSVVVMNYMDVMNFDLARIRECSMSVAMEDGRLIPFCSYQLTNTCGTRLHPTWGRAVAETNASMTTVSCCERQECI
ncbi:MAG: radical SAM protein [Coriobacteriia bacterium]|nr:radical SAM protein [Coriobacteriia bacterium]